MFGLGFTSFLVAIFAVLCGDHASGLDTETLESHSESHRAVTPVAHDPNGRIRALDRLIAEQPENALLFVRRGDLHRQVGHLALAFRDFDRATRLQPELPDIHLARALSLIDSGRATDAVRSLDRFLELSPRHGFGALTRARTLTRLGRRHAAARAFDRAIEVIDSYVPEHFLEHAQAHAALGADGTERARAILRRGIATLGPVVSLTAYARRLGVDVGEVVRHRREQPTPPSARPAEIVEYAPLTSPPPTTFLGETVLSKHGSVWKYLDDGSDQGTAWRARTFSDTTWKSGPAQLGYGDGDEATVVSFGPNPSSKFITTYFRRSFQVASLAQISQARLLLLLDDGVVVYLNGVEIARHNMPTGPVGYQTLASSDVNVIGEAVIHSIYVDHRLLRVGQNVLAAEIHQVDATSDDISFELELRSSDGVPVVERTYLQMGSDTRATVRWRTDYPTETVLFFGSNIANLTPTVRDSTLRTEHTAVLTGLTPDTKYVYAVGNNMGILAGGVDYTLRTAPRTGTSKKTRIWAIGDSGTGGVGAAAVRDAYKNHAGSTPTDVWLMLGDNAYQFGTDFEYQGAVFNMFPKLLRSTFLWPTIGNHDTATATSNNQTGPYYDIFDLPKGGEAGGVASGTEAYYSFDHGDIHFVSLNSEDVLRSPSGAMLTWLKADLAATNARWIIAYWHQPPYSKGSHDSDNPLEFNMQEMRRNALPILEAAGVDLVLTGHSHSYERSYLLNGHYSNSSNLLPGMLKDRGDGRLTGHGTYAKPSARKGANEGTVYVVAGNAGLISGGPLNHRAMVVSLNTLGSMILDIDGNKLTARFLDATGTVRDDFTIQKGLKRTLTRTEPTISVCTGGTQDLALDAGSSHAGSFFLLAGSLGTSPGFPLGGVRVPLNPDVWFRTTLAIANSAVFQNTSGTLDFRGRANARISMPPLNLPTLVGVRFHHAYVVYDARGVRMASNPVSLTAAR